MYLVFSRFYNCVIFVFFSFWIWNIVSFKLICFVNGETIVLKSLYYESMVQVPFPVFPLLYLTIICEMFEVNCYKKTTYQAPSVQVRNVPSNRERNSISSIYPPVKDRQHQGSLMFREQICQYSCCQGIAATLPCCHDHTQ